jgi:hypothetical protein
MLNNAKPVMQPIKIQNINQIVLVAISILTPNDPRITNFKVREHAFMIPLKGLYPDIILDKIISGGCSKHRPDGLLDMITHSIIIEIDEDQHSSYESICENRRSMELFTDLGNRPLVFIRLNPDGYHDGIKKINSAFYKTKDGKLKINEEEFNYRFKLLTDAIDAVQSEVPTKNVSYIKLCYTEE